MDTSLTWRPPRWAAPVTFGLSVVGLGLSAYLTHAHYGDPASLVCSESGLVDCLKVTTSNQSMIFGFLPVAVAGLVFYAVMVLLTSPWAWRATLPPLRWARTAGVVSGVGMVAYLVYVELFELDAICLWCSAVHVVTLVLFVVTLIATALARPLSDVDEYDEGLDGDDLDDDLGDAGPDSADELGGVQA